MSSAPSTPMKSAPASPATTGSWRHPALDDIAKRNANKRPDMSFKRLTMNAFALIASFAMFTFLRKSEFLLGLTPSSPTFHQYFSYVLWSARCVLAFNVGESIIRLLAPADEFTDISLTPEQRKLLGLNPNTPLSASASIGNIVTPPRYTKSTPSSRTGSPSFGASTSGSPTLQRKSTPQTPPPMTPSPLRMGGGLERRQGNGIGSPSGGPFSGGSPGVKLAGASVVPGNKWLYEKNIQRKNEGLRFSPSKSIFSTPRA
ncbi:nuclear pore complex component-domain-containing protein [Tuber indicum]|nr:nuclear pore complex component-domain-containing protein [Tuber indicum]